MKLNKHLRQTMLKIRTTLARKFQPRVDVAVVYNCNCCNHTAAAVDNSSVVDS